MGREVPSADERAGEGGVSRRSTSVDRSVPSDGRRSTEPSGEPNGFKRTHGKRRGSREPAGIDETGKSSDERAALSLCIHGRDGRFTARLRAVCFWTAIVLPFLYVPLLIIGVDTRSEGLALFVLLALNVLSLLVGHPYHD